MGKACLAITVALVALAAGNRLHGQELRSAPLFTVGRPVPLTPTGLPAETPTHERPRIRLQSVEQEITKADAPMLRPQLQQPQPIIRAQGPPPPPLPPPTSAGALTADEAYNCGVVPHEGSGGFFQNCWGRCCDMCRGFPGSFAGMFQPGADRGILQSDCEFNAFISPVSSPFYLEDPRALTEIRPLFIFQHTPNANQAWAGGNNYFFGARGSVALTPNVSIVLTKLGWMWTDPDSNNPAGISSGNGFAEVHVGPKFTIIRNVDTGTLLASGVNFEIPCGNQNVFQNTGNFSVEPYISVAQNFGKNLLGTYGSLNFLNTTGYTFRTDDVRNEFLFSGFHLDYNVGNQNRWYPLVEVNWFHYTRDGNAQQPFVGFGGADMFNFGTNGVAGHNELICNFGGRWKPAGRDSFQLGATVGFNALGGSRTLNNIIVTTDLIFRY